jgi:hypothetical protein
MRRHSLCVGTAPGTPTFAWKATHRMHVRSYSSTQRHVQEPIWFRSSCSVTELHSTEASVLAGRHPHFTACWQ